MGSEFDAMAGAFSAPAIRQQFAERNPAGEVDEGAVVFELSAEQKVPTGGIVGPIEVHRDYESEGGDREAKYRIEEVEVRVLSGVVEPQLSVPVYVATLPHPLRPWRIEDLQDDDIYLTVKLSRRSLITKQKAGAERGNG